MNSIYRCLDANVNRLREALRVIEDVIRFDREDVQLSKALKDYRHTLVQNVAQVQNKWREARDTSGDIGTKIEGQDEYLRSDLRQILLANGSRVSESMRSLEEVAKCVDSNLAKFFESKRYEWYQLEQKILSFRSFPSPCLYVILTRSLCTRDPEEVLKQCVDAEVDVVQFREKEMEDGPFLEWVMKGMNILKGSSTYSIINDRPHIARLSGADGVHQGQGDLPTSEVRKLLSYHQWLGRSTHQLSDAQQAEAEGVDYIGVGPLYPTQTKEHRESVGLEYLNEVQTQTKIPYVGIGSVNRKTWPLIKERSPSGIAICTGIISSKNPYEEAIFYKKELRSLIDQD